MLARETIRMIKCPLNEKDDITVDMDIDITAYHLDDDFMYLLAKLLQTSLNAHNHACIMLVLIVPF